MGARSVLLLAVVISLGVGLYYYSSTSHISSIKSEPVATENQASASTSPPMETAPAEPVMDMEITKNRRSVSTSSTVLHSSEGSLLKTRKLPSSYNIKAKVAHHSVDSRDLRTDPWLQDMGWKIWSGKRAVLGGVSETRIGGYAIEDGQASTVDQFSSQSPILVFDEDTATAGVITGTYEVMFKNAPVAAETVSYEGVRVLSAVPELGVFYLTAAQEPFDLRQFKSFLDSLPNVKSVKLIVKSRSREKF